jgi:hypothetical protein
MNYKVNKELFVQNLYYLTDLDLLVWELEDCNTDCKYVAQLGNMTLRLNCDLAKRYLFIDNDKLDINKEAMRHLCRLILNQRKRDPIGNLNIKIEKLNNVFEELLADKDAG